MATRECLQVARPACLQPAVRSQAGCDSVNTWLGCCTQLLIVPPLCPPARCSYVNYQASWTADQASSGAACDSTSAPAFPAGLAARMPARLPPPPCALGRRPPPLSLRPSHCHAPPHQSWPLPLPAQTLALYGSWLRARRLPGGDKMVALTRLLHRSEDDDLSPFMPTYRTTPMHPGVQPQGRWGAAD